MFYYLSTCVGPTLAGFLVESLGFRSTTFTFVILFTIVLLINVIELIYLIRNTRTEGYVEI